MKKEIKISCPLDSTFRHPFDYLTITDLIKYNLEAEEVASPVVFILDLWFLDGFWNFEAVVYSYNIVSILNIHHLRQHQACRVFR